MPSTEPPDGEPLEARELLVRSGLPRSGKRPRRRRAARMAPWIAVALIAVMLISELPVINQFDPHSTARPAPNPSEATLAGPVVSAVAHPLSTPASRAANNASLCVLGIQAACRDGGPGPSISLAPESGSPSSWTNITPPTLTPADNPSVRILPAEVYDPAAHATILFGGEENALDYLADTWSVLRQSLDRDQRRLRLYLGDLPGIQRRCDDGVRPRRRGYDPVRRVLLLRDSAWGYDPGRVQPDLAVREQHLDEHHRLRRGRAVAPMVGGDELRPLRQLHPPVRGSDRVRKRPGRHVETVGRDLDQHHRFRRRGERLPVPG